MLKTRFINKEKYRENPDEYLIVKQDINTIIKAVYSDEIFILSNEDFNRLFIKAPIYAFYLNCKDYNTEDGQPIKCEREMEGTYLQFLEFKEQLDSEGISVTDYQISQVIEE